MERPISNDDFDRPDRETRRNSRVLTGHAEPAPSLVRPVLSPALAVKLIERFSRDFEAGVLQVGGMPGVTGRARPNDAMGEILPWREGKSTHERYTIWISRSYRGQGQWGPRQRLNVTIVSRASIRLKTKDERYIRLTAWFANQILTYIRQDQLGADVPNHNASGELTVEKLTDWFSFDWAKPIVIGGKSKVTTDPKRQLSIGDTVRHCDASPGQHGTIGAFAINAANEKFAVGARHTLSNLGEARPNTDIVRDVKRDRATPVVASFAQPDAPFTPGTVVLDDIALAKLGKGADGTNVLALSKSHSLVIDQVAAVRDPVGDSLDTVLVIGRDQRLFKSEIVGVNANIDVEDEAGNIYFEHGLVQLQATDKELARLESRLAKGDMLSLQGDSGAAVVLPDPQAIGKLISATLLGIIVAGNNKGGRNGVSFFVPAQPFFKKEKLKLAVTE